MVKQSYFPELTDGRGALVPEPESLIPRFSPEVESFGPRLNRKSERAKNGDRKKLRTLSLNFSDGL
jgi:hypothetical protein